MSENLIVALALLGLALICGSLSLAFGWVVGSAIAMMICGILCLAGVWTLL
jgi:hypothetical protein